MWICTFPGNEMLNDRTSVLCMTVCLKKNGRCNVFTILRGTINGLTGWIIGVLTTNKLEIFY